MPDNPSSARPTDEQGFYRLLLEHAAVPMIATDAHYRVVAWNAATGELLGRPAKEMIGESIFQIVPPGRAKLLGRLLDRATQRELTSHLEVRVAGPDGDVKHVTVVLSPIPAPAGDCQGVAAWILDGAYRRQPTERPGQAERIASLGTLAGRVAHHFNNILGGVATFVDDALTRGDPAAMKRALQMTAEASARAVKITQSLLGLARQDAQQEDLADLTEVVLTFVHLVERPLAERGIRLNLDLRSIPIVAVESNRMHQVLGNLLTNAEEAMPEGGTVSLGLDRVGKHVRLTFSDTGCGICSEHLPWVFEPFFTTKGLLAGAGAINPGLGLCVAREIVAEMGGTLEVASQVGKGTTFTMSFPIVPVPGP